jgi:medium-chain acyl-[acyl-carrier-protein] hydrolase
MLQAFQDIPFAIFGHSLGALIGFELARSLRQSGSSSPVRLFVSACLAPQLPRRRKPIHELPEPAFIAELAQVYSVPPAFLQDRDLLDVFLPLLRSDFALFETYTYTPAAPLACPISAFYGRDDPNTDPLDVAGWRSQTSAAFSLRMIPGDHFFIHPHGKLLINQISADLSLERARQGEGSRPVPDSAYLAPEKNLPVDP